MPLSGAERQKRYMERLKLENPLKFEEKRKAHLEKVKQRNIKISDLSEEEKLIQRLKWRDANKKKKLRKDEKTQKEREEKLKQIREKRAAAENVKLKKKNKLLESKIEQLNRKINCLKKNLYRTKKNLHQLKDQINSENSFVCISEDTEVDTRSQNMVITPNSKTNYFIDSLSETVSDDDRNRIKRKVFELNVLSESLKSEYGKAETNDTKRKFKRIVNNDITQKYQMKTNLTQKLGLEGRVRIKQSQKQPSEVKHQDIQNFFLRDDVSRSTAGKKETKTLKKVKVQKRFLNDTLDNLYETKYKKEGGKASRTTFGRYKPFYVRTPNANDRDTCLCTKHTNLKMKAEKLKILGVIKTTSYSELIDEITCDKNSKICMYSECTSCKEKTPTMDTSINNQKETTSWYKWVLKSHEYSKHQPGSSKSTQQMITKKYTKDLITGSVEMLVEEFVNELHAFKRHYFNVGIQESAFKMCRETIKEDEIVLICDFSENYACKMSEEIQSAHFGASKNQFTLQTGVIYTKAHEPQSFCTISPSNFHDPGAIWAHLKPAIDLAKNLCPSARVLHIWSDGPTTQYRQKKNFYLFNKLISEDIFDYATWSYFEASHGKGPADGVGGAIKRKLDDLVAYGHDVPSAEVAYDLLKAQESDVIKFYISEENITKMQDLIPDNLLALPGTMKVHQIICNNSESVFYRDVSCFCGTENRGLCQCYDCKEHTFIPKEKNIKRAISKSAKQQNCNKRRKKSNSSDTEIDSDVTYADTSEYEEGDISVVELDRNYLIDYLHGEEEEQMITNHIIKEKYEVSQNNTNDIETSENNETEQSKQKEKVEQKKKENDDALKIEKEVKKEKEREIRQEIFEQEKKNVSAKAKEFQNNTNDVEIPVNNETETSKQKEKVEEKIKENDDALKIENEVKKEKEREIRQEIFEQEKKNVSAKAKEFQNNTNDVEIPVNNETETSKQKEKVEEKIKENDDALKIENEVKKEKGREKEKEIKQERYGRERKNVSAKASNNETETSKHKENVEEKIKEKDYALKIIKEVKKENGEEKEKEIKQEKYGQENISAKVKEASNEYPSKSSITLLSDIQLTTVLDENTGKFKFILMKQSHKKHKTPVVGQFILAKFYTKQSKKIYRYVCVINEVYGNKIVVQGLKSRKSKNIFRLLDNDISIIEIEDIIKYLPEPLRNGDNYIFANDIDIREA
ncbi:unnamed protein product [Colias eurytheme]|nr:unnamed protein product [Colias eurytheme]